MKPLVSVNLCARNEEQYIKGCLDSLLSQTFKDFEIIIVDDASLDRTLEIIRTFSDARVKCFKNIERIGVPKSRNLAIKYSAGEYIFFTDADCIVKKNWIEEGLRCLEAGYVGVEGRLIYVSENYQPTFSTRFMEINSGGHYITGCVAYRKDMILAAGAFNEKINYNTDRDLGLKISKFGRVCFNKEMIAIHPLVRKTPLSLLKSASHIESRVYLFKTFRDAEFISGRVVNPFNLATIFFPGSILIMLFIRKFKRREDYALLPFLYPFAVLERIYMWKASVKYRVFLI